MTDNIQTRAPTSLARDSRGGDTALPGEASAPPRDAAPPRRVYSRAIQRTWTDAQKKRLTELWALGYSASSIVQSMGCVFTREAILGQVHRLKLPQRPTTVSQLIPATPKPPRKKRPYHRRPAGQKAPAKPKAPIVRAKVSKYGGLPMHAPKVREPSAPRKEYPLPSDARPVCLMDAQPWHCRYVIGEPNGPHTIYCGAIPERGLSYCPYHARIAYNGDYAKRAKAEASP
jgi:GcrA cell cycle regulator